MNRWPLVTAFVLIGVGCARSSPNARATPPLAAPAATARGYDGKTLSTLALLSTGRPLQPEQARVLATEIASGKRSLPAFVDELLASHEFAYDVAPQMVLKETTAYNVRIHEGLVLASTMSEGREVYHWRGHPCAAKDAVSVSPWWDLKSKVLVCEDAYRPDVFTTTNEHIKCSAAVGWGSQGVVRDRCGCGPYLIRCVRDQKQRSEVAASVLGEAVGTIGYVIEHDLPFSEAFVSQSTFRDRYGEFLLRRDALERRETTAPPDFEAWPAEGAYAPRVENYSGEHAGILTSPLVRWTQDAKRAVMKMVFDLIWCIPPSSIGVNADDILKLGTGDIRAGDAGQQELAKMPVCTGCHARLDYATKFFTSFSDSGFALYGNARPRTPGRGPLYALNIDDHRGDAELTPREFAALAVKQPEYTSCMAQDIGAHVFGDSATPADLEAIQSIMAQQKTLRSAFREALLRWASRPERPEIVLSAATSALDAQGDQASVLIPTALRAQLDAHCGACHSGSDETSFDRPRIARRTLIEMLNRVSFKSMPKGQPLAPGERQQLLDGMIDALWADPVSRRTAEAYFVRWNRADRAPGMQSSLLALGVRVGAESSSKPPSTIDGLIGGEYRQLTPGYATVVALQALEMCRAAGFGEGAARERCLSHALVTADHVLPEH